MLSIKKIGIRGFKSLGNRQINLELNKGITALTGPNGGGKSNLLDSITFGLGQNSPKRLRVGKLSSLLSENNLGVKSSKAKVTLVLDNSSRVLPIDHDQVTIGRELLSNGDSRYWLDGKRVSKSTITDLLSLGSIDVNGHNVVLQGNITRTSELLPDEKRKVIEEIAGIDQFDQKKTESIKQLQEADLRLEVAVAKIGEVQKNISILESERNDQIRFQQLEDQIRWMKAVVASEKLTHISNDVNDLTRSLNDLSLKNNSLSDQLSQSRSEISELETERAKFISEVVDNRNDQLVSLQELIGNANSNISQFNKQITDSKNSLLSSESEFQSLIESERSLESQINELSLLLLNDSKSIKNLEKSKSLMSADLVSIERKIKQLSKLHIKSKEIVQLNEQKILQYTEDNRENLSKIVNLEERLKLNEDRKQSLLDKSNDFISVLEHLETQCNNIKNIKTDETKSLVQLDEVISSLNEKETALKSELLKSENIVFKANETILKHEAEKSLANKLSSEQLDVKRLDDIAKEGDISGYVGVLSSLINYDKKYEKAILASGKRWLNSIIVDDVASMLKLVALSKKLKLGRLTIIPLSELISFEKIDLSKSNGVLGLLSDFITIDGVPNRLCNFIFGDTVLVNSSPIAYTLSQKNIRSVSLNGDLFEPLITVFETGSFDNLNSINSLFGSSSSFKDVKDIVISLEKIMSTRKTELVEITERLHDSKKNKAIKSVKFDNILSEIQETENFISKYIGLKKNIEVNLNDLSKESKSIISQINHMKKSYNSISIKIDSFKKKIADSAFETQSKDIADLENKRKSIIDEFDGLNNSYRDQITTLTRNKAELDHSLQSKLSSIIQRKDHLVTSKSQSEQLINISSVELEKVTINLNALDQEKSQLIKSISGTKSVLEDYDNRVSKLRNMESNTSTQIINLEKKISNLNSQIERLHDNEERIKSEITLYGFSSPIQYFVGANDLLGSLIFEYDEIRSRVNNLANTHYSEIYEGYKNLSIRRNKLEHERHAIMQFIEGIDVEKTRVYTDTLSKIDKELRLLFNKLTGGSAWLEIEKPEDIFGSGLLLMVEFPGKIARESSSVSGGEKTVSALAFILAIQSVYPSPFYLFDEVDAHLDAKNSEKLADLLKDRSKNSQIIIVSLKDSIVTNAESVYGVYMTDGVSNVIKYTPKMEILSKNV